MVRYIVMEHNAASERRHYGIAAMLGGKNIDKIDDVALRMEEAMVLADLLQDNGVAPEHFRDVVEDYIAGSMTVV